jgi:nicotinamidase-related amidase
MRLIEVTIVHGDKILVNPRWITRVYKSPAGSKYTRIEHYPYHSEFGEMNYTDVEETREEVAQRVADAVIVQTSSAL